MLKCVVMAFLWAVVLIYIPFMNTIGILKCGESAKCAFNHNSAVKIVMMIQAKFRIIPMTNRGAV